MKDIMAQSSSEQNQGVPSFTYSPAADQGQSLLFELNRPLDDLKRLLLSFFAGQTLSMREINQAHSVDTPYIAKNYKSVLQQLENESLIETDRGSRPKRGFADDIRATFPKRN